MAATRPATRSTTLLPSARSSIAFGCLAAGAVASAAIVAADRDAQWTVIAAIGTMSVVAALIGIRVHRPAVPSVWWLIAAALALFTMSCVVSRFGGIAGADGVRYISFVAMGAAVAWWVRARRGRTDMDPVIDGVLVALGVLLLAWVALSSIISAIQPAGSSVRFGAILFPAFDLAMTVFVVYLVVSLGRPNRALQWLMVTFVATFVADLLLLLSDADSATPHPLFSTTAFGIALVATALAALDPSMKALSYVPLTVPTRRIEIGTLLLIVLVLGSLLPIVVTTSDRTDLVVRSVLLSVVLTGTILRSEQALRSAKRSEDRARHDATHDYLTGLPNRSVLASVLAKTAAAEPVTVLFIDLDNFKVVNDSYGHAIGDRLLNAVGERIEGELGPDDVVIRYAGDEFVVVTNLEPRRADTLGRRIIATIEPPFVFGAVTVRVSATIGESRASSLPNLEALSSLIGEADSAMYRAKELGPGRLSFFDETQRDAATASVRTATALWGARARGEFEVFYQPIVDATSRNVVAFEALVRWRQDGVLRSPDEFIRVAETINLIGEIGEFVLDTAVSDLVALRASGYPQATMSVNVSAVQLRDDTLPEVVRGILARHEVDGPLLGLEVTESVLIDDFERAESVLRRISEQDILIILDDFGVGFSSLNRLQRLPIDVMKIDKSFVAGVSDDLSSKTLVTAIAAMADALDIFSVAEGVETEAQMVAVAEAKCRFAQGYLLGRPQPIEHWLSAVTSTTDSASAAGN